MFSTNDIQPECPQHMLKAKQTLIQTEFYFHSSDSFIRCDNIVLAMIRPMSNNLIVIKTKNVQTKNPLVFMN